MNLVHVGQVVLVLLLYVVSVGCILTTFWGWKRKQQQEQRQAGLWAMQQMKDNEEDYFSHT